MPGRTPERQAAPAHLLTYDSTYDRPNRPVEHDETSLTVGGHRIAVTAERDPAALDWGGLGVDKVLGDHFRVVKGLMTTIHGYTNDQVVLDGPHKDLRRARSAAVNIVPTTGAAARAVGLVLPEPAGTPDGSAVRVPVEDGSLTDLTVVLGRAVGAEEINAAYREAAEGPLKDVLRVSDATIVSRDVVGDPAS